MTIIPSLLIAALLTSSQPVPLVAGSPESPMRVSIINLIATPDKYHGKTVLITGFVNVEFEGNMVCLNKEDRDSWASKNCLWLDLDRKKRYGRATDIVTADDQYAIVVGVFDKNMLGHMDCCSGQITSITRVMDRN